MPQIHVSFKTKHGYLMHLHKHPKKSHPHAHFMHSHRVGSSPILLALEHKMERASISHKPHRAPLRFK